MVKINIVSPVKALVSGSPEDLQKIRKELSYKHSGAEFAYRKHLQNRWFKQKDPVKWEALKLELKDDIKRSCLFFEDGSFWLRPGSIPYISDLVSVEIESQLERPKAKPVPWYKPLPFTLYPYQTLSVDKLIEEGHGNIELCTGSGKTATILSIYRRLGLKTVVFTPSTTIFLEMLKAFETHFGKASVGAIGDGIKRLNKPVMICISKSLSMLKPGSPEYDDIASCKVMLSDECHTNPSETLEKVCHGVLANVPYRFFLSGTMTRGDGTETLLQSIVGKTVHSLSTKEAIAGGYICDHRYTIVNVQSSNPNYTSNDALKMKRFHLLNNENIAKLSAKIANSVFKSKGEQTLILVEELSQIASVVKYLEVPYAYATGGGSKKELEELGLEKSDPTESVEKFNRGQVKVLIGTSCISTGTNIFPTHHTINWQGGTSEIKTKQGAVGRSVRKLKGSKFESYHVPKNFAMIWDFNVVNIPDMERHLEVRLGYYKDSGTDIKFVG